MAFEVTVEVCLDVCLGGQLALTVGTSALQYS